MAYVYSFCATVGVLYLSNLSILNQLESRIFSHKKNISFVVENISDPLTILR
jgi:hypothetical protein